jgi:hypothetical protein
LFIAGARISGVCESRFEGVEDQVEDQAKVKVVVQENSSAIRLKWA